MKTKTIRFLETIKVILFPTIPIIIVAIIAIIYIVDPKIEILRTLILIIMGLFFLFGIILYKDKITLKP